MRILSAVVLLVGSMYATTALTGSSSQPTSARSPLLGSWTVDTSRLAMPPEARPKRVTITFSDAGRDRWTIEVDIVGADGVEGAAEATYALDGSTVPIHGYAEADVGALTRPESNVLILALGNGGMPASTRIYTVDPDGERLIETAVSTAGNGLPLMRTNVFSRVKSSRSK